jgi:hypothetical protein
MYNKKVSNESFNNFILKGNVSLLDSFTPCVIERKVGGDVFFEIQKNTEHHFINERIIKFIFSRIPINSLACGFVKDKSYFDFLKYHINGYYFLRLDIKKFFHSISFYEIKSLIKDNFSSDKGNSKYSAFDIALMSVTHKVSNNFSDEDLRGRNILPIGFPSSPVISNILFRRIDILIQKFCEDKKITYSRYADDLLFSSLNGNFLHGEQFEKEISIFISNLSLKLKNKKRKASENTISLNGYVIHNNKQKKLNFFNVYKEDPVGTIRLSDKKLKVIKKLVSYIKKDKPPIFIMEKLFNLSFDNFKFKNRNDITFYSKYAHDQLQNKLKGYRSYLVSLIVFDSKHGCVDKNCLNTVKDLVSIIEKKIN